MKYIKTLMILLSFSFIFNSNLYVNAEASSSDADIMAQLREVNDLIIRIDGKDVEFNDTNPIMVKGRLLVPLRAIFEAMGSVVNWDGKNKTTYATRQGRAIELAVNSNIAFVNDQEVMLDVPAMLYKDRAMVPLRFIGEAFGGLVIWDNETNTAAITLPQEEIEEIQNMVVYLNDKKTVLERGSIFKDGRMYLPLEAIFDSMENEVYWEKTDKKILVQIDGASIELFVNTNYAIVNGEKVNSTTYPIEYNGEILAPIRFIAEALGGTAHYDKETEEVHIYINRPKFINEFLTKEAGEIVKPVNVPGAILAGNRRLMVSDNPEILNEKTIPADNATLWHDTVKENKAAIDHRVFGWHVNNLNKNVKVGITIENLSTTNEIEIVDLKGIARRSPNGWSSYDVGLPIAEAVLSDKLLNIKINNPIIKSGEIALLQSFDLDQNIIFGFLNDFTVKKATGTGELNYRIRTVLSQSEDELTTIRSVPVPIDKENTHPRGVWLSSELVAELPVYHLGSEEVAYKLSNGITDNLMTESTSLDSENSIKNTGHYGAVYKVKIPIINDTGEAKKVRLRVSGRGGVYAGAVKTKDGVFLIPVIEPFKEIVNIGEFEIVGKEEVIEIEIMHAGGAALAMAIDIQTLD